MTEAFSPTRTQMERYIQGRLTGEEEAQVEIWLLENPDAVDDLQYDQALRLGIKEIGPEVASQPQERRRQDLPSWLTWITRPSLAAAAATITFVAILAPTIVAIRLADQNQRLSEDLALMTQPTDTVYTLPLELTRGAGDRPDARIVLRETPYTVVFEIPIRAWRDEFDQFSVLLNAGEREHVFIEPVITDRDRIRLALNTAALRAGKIQIVLRGDKKQITSFIVTVEPQTPR